jgi:hypothetical protein
MGDEKLRHACDDRAAHRTREGSCGQTADPRPPARSAFHAYRFSSK